MSCCEPKMLTGSALDASETSETKKGRAVYTYVASKPDCASYKFKSFAEKYAFIRGKAACAGTPMACLSATCS